MSAPDRNGSEVKDIMRVRRLESEAAMTETTQQFLERLAATPGHPCRTWAQRTLEELYND